MRGGPWMLIPVVVVGVAAAVAALAAHEGDPSFVFAQQHPSRIEPTQLEAIIEMTREPLASGPGRRAVSARCIPGRSGPKLNPWQCAVSYGSGDSIAYRVVVQPSGRFHGVDD